MPPAPLAFPMLHNNGAGVCVLSDTQHHRMATDSRLSVPCPPYSDAQELTDYQTQNPDFRSWADGGTSRDGGMVMQTWFEELVRQRRIAAFGRLDPDPEVIRSALWIMGGVSIGSLLDEAQADQFDRGEPWDYVATSPEWGGHATALDGYSIDRFGLVTWAEQTEMTLAFLAHQVEEVWLVLWPEQVRVPPPGFDLAGFAGAVRDVTGGKVDPLDFVDPPPDDPPPPDPVPEGCLTVAPKEFARGVRTAWRRARYGWG
jgi:hypothetical protein